MNPASPTSPTPTPSKTHIKTSHRENSEGLDVGQNFKSLAVYPKYYLHYHNTRKFVTCKHGHTSSHRPQPRLSVISFNLTVAIKFDI